MKTVCELNMCTGCMACADICPNSAIEIKDTIAAYNAVISMDKCSGCNLCLKTCPNVNPVQAIKPAEWYQGWAEDESVRSDSASGGYATAIASAFVENGGTVYSCAFSCGEFGFELAESIPELKKFAGSKYVKSSPKGIYKQINSQLKNGKRILFIGLPCQVAALKSFIDKKHQNNLFTVDIICHGTPSPKVLELYLKQHGIALNKVQKLSFRHKENYRLEADGMAVGIKNACDSYMLAFLNGCIFTENCYSCAYAKQERVSDLTLGDSWGSDLLAENKKSGVSLALCQTEKGKELLENARIYKTDVDLEKAMENNLQLRIMPQRPGCRDLFIDKIVKGESIDKIAFRYLFKSSVKQLIKSFLFK